LCQSLRVVFSTFNFSFKTKPIHPSTL
jgi:hypothetical protein